MAFEDVNAMLAGTGGKAFPFDAIGDSVTGVIVDAAVRQQTDMETGEPLTWKDGSPRNLIVITLQTELQDDADDDGLRRLFLRGGNHQAQKGSGTASLTAVRDAAKRATGKANIEAGATLTLTHTGLGAAPSRGKNPPKLYEAEYKAAQSNVDLEDLF